MVCGKNKGEQDELKIIISAWLKALHDSFPKADPSAAFITHGRKANANQIMWFFFLYCSTAFHRHTSPSKEIGKNKN